MSQADINHFHLFAADGTSANWQAGAPAGDSWLARRSFPAFDVVYLGAADRDSAGP